MTRCKAVHLAANAAYASEDGFAHDLIRWQKKHGRHSLPWQQTRDPYRIWLSEIMLQQTQVAAVIPYYQRFLVHFPDIFTLAAAPVAEVMALWSGLGYYSRARNLHQCVQILVANHAGVFPSDPIVLASLPGIGRSTAAAIAVFAYGARAAILDGNVKRVFARAFGVEGYPGSKPVEDMLWRRAEALLPQTDIESYTQGLMDLGATVCIRSRPACDVCPLAERCNALATGRVNELPTRKPKKPVPERRVVMLVIIDKGQVLLEQRPDFGIWGGLLSLPEIEWSAANESGMHPDMINHATMRFGEMDSRELVPPFAHGFTHFRLHIHPCLVTLKHRTEQAAEAGHAWYALDQLAQLPLPAPVRKLLERVGSGK